MAPPTAPARPGPALVLRTVLTEPFKPRTWLESGHAVLAFPLGMLWFTVLVTLLAVGIGLIPLALTGLVVLFVTLFVVEAAAGLERELARTLLGVNVDPPIRRTPAGPGPIRLFRARVADPVSWKELLYLLLSFPVGLVGFTLASVLWAMAATGLTFPLWGPALLDRPGRVFSWVSGPDVTVADTASMVGAGALALLTVPWALRAVSLVRAAMVHGLLGRTRDQELTEQVERLAESRNRSVDIAADERARIERNLHDGAQTRLVSLAVDLGRARARLTEQDASSETTALVARAHDQAKVALGELRDLARGIYPAVLTDRGLDAALSSLVAGSPVPVRLELDLPERPAPRIEAVAYFVLAELLVNVARHSGAAQARVTVDGRQDRLLLTVHDDGVGGADPAGAGLTGLRHRIEAVDGTLHVHSPSGGPTVVRAELPLVPG